MNDFVSLVLKLGLRKVQFYFAIYIFKNAIQNFDIIVSEFLKNIMIARTGI